MSVIDQVRELVLPVLAARGLDLYDVELAGSVVRVVVDGGDRAAGLDLDVLSDVTKAVSRTLDEGDPIAGRYTLEVTSPGLERRLRTPRHFERAVGERVRIRTAPGIEPDRRIEGVLTTADATGIDVETVGESGEPSRRRLAYGDIDRARTVFVWGPNSGAPRDGRPGGRRGRAGRKHTKERKP